MQDKADDATFAAPEPQEQEEEEVDEAAPQAEYADLLDAAWIERATDAEAAPEADMAGVELDLARLDEHDLSDPSPEFDFDVGSLLTLTPPGGSGALDVNASDLEAADAYQSAALRDVFLPEPLAEPLPRGDEEVGDDQRFPVFDDELAELPGSAADDDDQDGIAEDAG